MDDLYFEDFQCLTPEEVKKLYFSPPYKRVAPFDDPVQDLNHRLKHIQIKFKPKSKKSVVKHPVDCPVCIEPNIRDDFRRLECGHSFCNSCWLTHLEMQLSQGVSTKMQCMNTDCKTLVPEYFALAVLMKPNLRRKYHEFALRDCVQSHPELRFCPGLNCSIIIRAKRANSTRVTCNSCKSVFCFKCASDYHAPADCAAMKMWMLKCGDDVPTRNYLIAKAKSCPSCCYYIEKISGCNDVRCPNCKHNFCWLCLGSHEALLRCNRVQLNSNHAVESRSRDELEKYRFYFDRWENHGKSLVLEEARLMVIQRKVMRSEVMWDNWQYLKDAVTSLVRCRSTLKYACVFAYFMEDGSRKESFEYQQEQLEVGVEKLARKIHKDENDGRNLGHQAAVCEKIRKILLDFGH